MEQEQLHKILEDHEKWLNNNVGGIRASLKGANLDGANLEYSSLDYSSLKGANLDGASLKGVNLDGASLKGVNLDGANLDGVSIKNCIGNGKEIRSMQVDKYKIAYTKTDLAIGCEQHLIGDWKKFTEEAISAMDSGAWDWWNKWNALIFKAIDLSFNKEQKENEQENLSMQKLQH